MKTIDSKSKKKNSNLVAAIILTVLLVLPTTISAQTGPLYQFSYFNETYSPLTSGTPIPLYGELGASDNDDGLSDAISIGFTFIYNFKPYTKFKACANGFITLDKDYIWNSNLWLNYLESPTRKLIISPLWDDLKINTNGKIWYYLSGSVIGERKLIIEFNDLTIVGFGPYHYKFQVWLHEGTNKIEFRYGNTDGDWSNDNGVSIGLNDERDSSFVSVIPGAPPTYSFEIDRDDIMSNQYVTTGLVYSFTPALRWQGTTNSDWLTETNWELDTIPSAFDHALIPTGKINYPVLNVDGANCNDLTVESGGQVIISGGGELTVNGDLINNGTVKVSSTSEASTGSLIVKGNSTATISFERFLSGDPNWHLISAPVTGQNTWVWANSSENNIATKASKYAITTYNEGLDNWDNYPTTGPGSNFLPGTGYSTLRQTEGIVSFSGTINNDDVNDIPISHSLKGWNLLGNPYTSAIGATTDAASTEHLLSATNVSNLDTNYAGLYLWDPNLGKYVIINNSGGTPTGTLPQDYIQAGQGFFVRAKDNSSRKFDITRAMQVHQSGVAFKSGEKSWPTINLIAETNSAKSTTQICFNSAMTRGLDVTYDAGIFRKDSDFSLYSKLVDDNGTGFAIQCLPEEYETLVIPMVVEAQTGTKVMFSADVYDLPENCQPFLEDRITGKFYSLKSGNQYAVVIDERYKSQDVLFVHASNNSITQSKLAEIKEPFEIEVNRNEGFIRVTSDLTQPATARITDISGRIVEIKEINFGNNNLIRLSGKSGIYIIQIRSNKYNFSKKLFWNN